jgi:hypothetical protein
MNEPLGRPLTAADLTPSAGIEPVTIRLWSEPDDGGALRIALVIPDSQANTTAAAAGKMLMVTFAQVMQEEAVPVQMSGGRVH